MEFTSTHYKDDSVDVVLKIFISSVKSVSFCNLVADRLSLTPGSCLGSRMSLRVFPSVPRIPGPFYLSSLTPSLRIAVLWSWHVQDFLTALPQEPDGHILHSQLNLSVPVGSARSLCLHWTLLFWGCHASSLLPPSKACPCSGRCSQVQSLVRWQRCLGSGVVPTMTRWLWSVISPHGGIVGGVAALVVGKSVLQSLPPQHGSCFIVLVMWSWASQIHAICFLSWWPGPYKTSPAHYPSSFQPQQKRSWAFSWHLKYVSTDPSAMNSLLGLLGLAMDPSGTFQVAPFKLCPVWPVSPFWI